MYGCDDYYKCATDLILLSILSQSYNIIIYRVISAPGHGIEVVDVLNSTDKRFIFRMMDTVQIPGSKRFDTQMSVHIATQNTDVSLAQDLQKHLSNESRKCGIIYHGKHKISSSKKLDKHRVSCAT